MTTQEREHCIECGLPTSADEYGTCNACHDKDDRKSTITSRRHTPGPWEHGDNGLIYGQCRDDDVEAPFICDVIEDSAMQMLGLLSPVEEANARRICAAVNACEGISTEALEQGVVAELLEALEAQEMAECDPEASRRKGYFDRAFDLRRAALAKARANTTQRRPV